MKNMSPSLCFVFAIFIILNVTLFFTVILTSNVIICDNNYAIYFVLLELLLDNCPLKRFRHARNSVTGACC